MYSWVSRGHKYIIKEMRPLTPGFQNHLNLSPSFLFFLSSLHCSSRLFLCLLQIWSRRRRRGPAADSLKLSGPQPWKRSGAPSSSLGQRRSFLVGGAEPAEELRRTRPAGGMAPSSLLLRPHHGPAPRLEGVPFEMSPTTSTPSCLPRLPLLLPLHAPPPHELRLRPTYGSMEIPLCYGCGAQIDALGRWGQAAPVPEAARHLAAAAALRYYIWCSTRTTPMARRCGRSDRCSSSGACWSVVRWWSSSRRGIGEDGSGGPASGSGGRGGGFVARRGDSGCPHAGRPPPEQRLLLPVCLLFLGSDGYDEYQEHAVSDR